MPFDYRDKAGKSTARTAGPHRLVAHGALLVPRCPDTDRDDWRTFRVDRMSPRIPVGSCFTPRAVSDDVVAGFTSTAISGSVYRVQGRFVLHAPAADVQEWFRGSLGAAGLPTTPPIHHASIPQVGRRLAEQLIAFRHTCPIPELARLGRTLPQWRPQILAYLATGGVNNGGIEAINVVSEKIRHLAHGFRNFENDRLRLQFAADGIRPYRKRPTQA